MICVYEPAIKSLTYEWFWKSPLYMVRMTMLRVQVLDHAHVTESLSQAGKL